MNESELNWDDLKLFLAVARAGGLSGATAVTGKSAPTLGRRMLALEHITGAELFYRQPRGYVLTEKGTALLKKVIDLETQILPLDRSAETAGSRLVKISAGSWMTYVLCKNLQAISQDKSKIHLAFISAEHVLDIMRREAVIGIRNQRPQQSSLVCRKVGQVRFAGYALSKSIKPWIQVLGNTPSAIWLARQTQDSFGLQVNAPRNALDLALGGRGRALLPTFIGDSEDRLHRVTAPVAELTHEQWVVTHQHERLRPEVRNTIDRIYEVTRALHRT